MDGWALLDRNGDAVKTAAGELPRSIAITTDVSDAEQVKSAFQTTVSELGGIDVVFNNAAIDGRMARLHELDVEDWRQVAAVNGEGSFHVFKNAVERFLESGRGVIVSTVSTTAMVGKADGVSAYSYPKGGLIRLTRTAAIEYAADNIRINAVAPTVVLTPMLKQFIADSEDPAATQHMIDHFNPMPGVVTPEEVATVVGGSRPNRLQHPSRSACPRAGGTVDWTRRALALRVWTGAGTREARRRGRDVPTGRPMIATIGGRPHAGAGRPGGAAT